MTPDTVLPGELFVEPPTLINLGFEWLIQGDENRNASVAVAYRREGDESWHDALPMLRLNGERIYSEARVDLIAPNMFETGRASCRARMDIAGGGGPTQP